MRQIKFRAWHKKAKKMFLPEKMGQDEMCLNPDGRGFVNVSGISTKLSQYFPEMIPEQFTGLLDQYGKEIYEGDVIQFAYRTGTKDDSIKLFTGNVVWNDLGYWSIVVHGKEKWENALFDCSLSDIEIIGNIHENPELLK
jgi:uncharacterized phage protein (TIGR01671 family)